MAGRACSGKEGCLPACIDSIVLKLFASPPHGLLINVPGDCDVD
jgi:hypothetical protein